MKHLPLALALLLITGFASAQNFLGYSSDNYAGVHQVLVNPALLVDSKVKTDINLFSAAGSLSTDYADLSVSSISDILNAENLSDAGTTPKDDNRAWLYADVLGPSFAFKVSKKSAFALTTRVRALANFENINGELLESAINGFPDISYSFSQEDLNFQVHPFAEVGATYSRVLYDQDKFRVKGGVTVKYLLGGGVIQGFSDALNGRYSLFSGNVSLDGDFAFQTTLSGEDTESFDDIQSSVGFDLGFVLDIKPKEWENSGFTQTPYKWRIGVALNDLGNITYSGVEDQRYVIDPNDPAYQDIDGDTFEDDIEVALEPFLTTDDNRDLEVSIPSTLRLTVDYHIQDNFFANLDIQQNLVSEDGPTARSLNRLTLTPRWETRSIGVYVPISTSEFAEGSMGLGIRLGPLFLGSHTLFSQLFSDNARIANVYVGLKIPVNHKKIAPISR